MAHAVQDHLGDGGLARLGLAAGFIIDGLGQAFEIARLVQRAPQVEGLGRGLSQRGVRGRQAPLGADEVGLQDRGLIDRCRRGGAGGLTGLQALDQGGHLTVVGIGLFSGQGIVALGDRQHRCILIVGRRVKCGIGEAAGRSARQPLYLGMYDRGFRQAAGKVSAADRQAHGGAERDRADQRTHIGARLRFDKQNCLSSSARADRPPTGSPSALWRHGGNTGKSRRNTRQASVNRRIAA